MLVFLDHFLVRCSRCLNICLFKWGLDILELVLCRHQLLLLQKTFDMPIHSVGGLCWLGQVLLSYSYWWLLSMGWMLFLLLPSMRCVPLVCLALIIFWFFILDYWKMSLGRWHCCLFLIIERCWGGSFSFTSPRSTFLRSSIATSLSIGASHVNELL